MAIDNQICASELALAGAYNKPILPVLVEDGVSDAFLPPAIAEVQRVDYRAADRVAMANLVRALGATEISTNVPTVEIGSLEPAGYAHDVEAVLSSADYLPPQLQTELIDQLGAATAGGLHVTKVLSLLQQFSDREDTTAKVAVKINALSESLAESGSTNAIYRLDIRDLPERPYPEPDSSKGGRKVFLSYSRIDHAVVSDLVGDIEGVGWDLWLDQKLPGGRKWWDEVLRRIRESDVIVFAASRASVNSRACHSELSYAVAVGKPLIGVVVGNEPAAALLTPQFADAPVLRYDDPSKKSFGDLYRALAATPAMRPLPDPLPVSPEVPATYMFDIRSQIQSGEVLTPSDQEQLLGQLRAYAKEGYPEHEVIELANDLHDRDDVTRRLSEELERFIAEVGANSAGHIPPPGQAQESFGRSAEADGVSPQVSREAVAAAQTGSADGEDQIVERTAEAPPSAHKEQATPAPRPRPDDPQHVVEAADDDKPARPRTVAPEPQPAVSTADAPPAVPSKRRKGLLVALLVAVLAAGGVAGAVILMSGDDDDASTTAQGFASTADAEDAGADSAVPETTRDPADASTTANDAADTSTTRAAPIVPAWDLAGLIPSLPGGLTLADYTVETSTTSSNCEDFDTDALVGDQAVQLIPRANSNHYVWAWTARFDSLEGVNSYLASWGAGCQIRAPDALGAIRLVPPTWLDDEVLWYVTLVEPDEGPAFVSSVGALVFTSRWVAEAQLVLNGADGWVELIEVDASAPYSSDRARELAEELVGPMNSILAGF